MLEKQNGLRNPQLKCELDGKDMNYSAMKCSKRVSHPVGSFQTQRFQRLSHCKPSKQNVALGKTSNAISGSGSQTKSGHKHKSTNSAERPYVCAECELRCKSKNTFQQHILKHHSSNSEHKCGSNAGVTCYLCDKVLKNVSALRRHEKLHLDFRRYACSECDRKFLTAYNLQVHFLVHTNYCAFSCTACDKKFKRRSQLNAHVQRAHEPQRDKDQWHGNSRYQSHSRTHKRYIQHERGPFLCSICNKKFTRRGALREHEFIHTGLRPHLCTICGKSFATKNVLCNHMRDHRMHLAHACPICDRKFTQRAALKRHLNVHTDGSPFLCPKCGHAFREKQSLDRHLANHDSLVLNCRKESKCGMSGVDENESHGRELDGRANMCTLCGQNLGCKRALDTHMRSRICMCHESIICFTRLRQHQQSICPEFKFICNLCNLRFRYAANLCKHKKNIHGNNGKRPNIKKPYPCTECEKKFKEKDHLQYHLAPRLCVCGNSFPCVSRLQDHQQSACTAFKFVCDVCNFHCRCALSVRKHKRKYHGELLQSIEYSEKDRALRRIDGLKTRLWNHKMKQLLSHDEDDHSKIPTIRSIHEQHYQTHTSVAGAPSTKSLTFRKYRSRIQTCTVPQNSNSTNLPVEEIDLDKKLLTCETIIAKNLSNTDAEKSMTISDNISNVSDDDSDHMKSNTLQNITCSDTENVLALVLKLDETELEETAELAKTGGNEIAGSDGDTTEGTDESIRKHENTTPHRTDISDIVNNVVDSKWKCRRKRSKEELIRRREKERVPYPCSKCNKRCRSLELLHKHEEFHSEERKFVCNLCEKRYRDAHSLRCHLASHADKRPYPCPECDRAFIKPYKLKLHRRVHTGELMFGCTVCDNRFYSRERLAMHRREAHPNIMEGPPPPKEPILCPVCGKSFNFDAHLREHMPTHTGERAFLCTTCGRSFAHSSSLTKHLKDHSGAPRPYKCTVCGLGFHRPSNLYIHSFSHGGERPLSCSMCGKRFVRAGDLKKHEGRHANEKERKERLFPCLQCDKRFVHKASWYKHRLTHRSSNIC